MRPHPQSSRSVHGGRHELGQNFLRSRDTIATITHLTRATSGPIMEIGPGDGAVTAELYRRGRPLTLVEIDETRLDHLAHSFPQAQVRHDDALRTRLDQPVVVGNLPFHLTTPILRRLLRGHQWHHAIVLMQWEVARKRAGIGHSTMMTAQWAPWYDFELIARVPADAFTPKPSVDGGILTIDRCPTGSIPHRHRSDYQQFVRSVFTGRGRGMKGILTKMSLTDQRTLHTTMDRNHVRGDTLPRDLTPQQWAGLYSALHTDDTQQTTSKSSSRSLSKPQPAQKKQKRTEKESTMRNSKAPKATAGTPAEVAARSTGAIPAVTGDLPTVGEKPVITGELPIIGAEASTAKLQATIPGANDATTKSHDKGHLQAERGFMNQHQKPQQPQPRWNLPRR